MKIFLLLPFISLAIASYFDEVSDILKKEDLPIHYHPYFGEVYKDPVLNLRYFNSSISNGAGDEVGVIVRNLFLTKENEEKKNLGHYLTPEEIGLLVKSCVKKESLDYFFENFIKKDNFKNIKQQSFYEIKKAIQNFQSKHNKEEFYPDYFVEKILLAFLDDKFISKTNYPGEVLKSYLFGLLGHDIELGNYCIETDESIKKNTNPYEVQEIIDKDNFYYLYGAVGYLGKRLAKMNFISYFCVENENTINTTNHIIRIFKGIIKNSREEDFESLSVYFEKRPDESHLKWLKRYSRNFDKELLKKLTNDDFESLYNYH